MEKQSVRITVELTANEGQLEAFMRLADAMTEVTKAEPGTAGYEWFAGADGRSFTLLESYVDAAAVEAHFAGPAVQQMVPKLVQIAAVKSFRIFGDPGPKVSEIALGLGAVIDGYWLGLGR